MTANLSLLPESCGAIFSDCNLYRYRLWRIWDGGKPYCMFLMLNPSTADHTQNDPTVERCMRRAQRMGYGGLYVGNIFAFRSTDPAVLNTTSDPVGKDNDQHIFEMAKNAGIVICGWGSDPAVGERGKTVIRLLKAKGIHLYALKFNADGSPRHPLYVSYSEQPKMICNNEGE